LSLLKRLNALAFGAASETKAERFLIDNGFDILERNFHAKKMGEIDIIALKDGVIHFVEVKSAQKSFDPINNLTPSKLQKIISSSHYYMQRKNLDMPFCIDLILLRGEQIEYLENVTL